MYQEEQIVYETWIEFQKVIGHKKISLQLRFDYGLVFNHKKVYRIMKQLGIQSIQRKKRYTSLRRHQVLNTYRYPNQLQRNFKSQQPYKKMCTDITEFHIGNKTLYLSSIIDLYNNKIEVYKYSRKTSTKLVIETLKSLDSTKTIDLILRSDQGFQYTSYEYKKLLSKLKVNGSMSRIGTPLDNAPIETFHSMIKSEIHLNSIKSIEELEKKVDKYIYIYNERRVQHKLKTPPNYYVK